METIEQQKIIVTGGDGFLGTYVVQMLQYCGVRNIFIPRSRHYNLIHIDHTCRLLRDYPPDQIIHLASTCLRINNDAKLTSFENHSDVTIWRNLIDVASKNHIPKITIILEYHAYPPWCHSSFNEIELDDLDNWSECQLHHPSQQLLKEIQSLTRYPYPVDCNNPGAVGCPHPTESKISVLITSEVYGPGDHFQVNGRRLLSSTIRLLSDAKEQGKSQVIVSGHPDDELDFLYALDAAEGIVNAIKSPSEIGIMNLASTNISRWGMVVEQIASYLDYYGEINWTESDRLPFCKSLQTENAKDTIGFYPATDLESGLKETIQWFCTHRRFILENETDASITWADSQIKQIGHIFN
jgi:GDP-L-fucose synthase